jgi:tetratricopeptide (TPR) repeat protein
METTGGGWLPALVMLAIGLAVGAIVIARVVAAGRAAKPLAAPVPLDRRDLEGRRDALIGQLRELEDTAAKRNPEQLARERYALEIEAARVLQRLDRESPQQPVAPAPSTEAVPAEAPAAAGGSALSGFLWGIGSITVVAALLYLVTQSAEKRPGGGAAMGGGSAPAESPAPDDAETRALRARVERDPDDLEARIELSRLALIRQDMMAVFNETQAVLQRSPGNARALAYQSVVRLAMGQPALAETMLKDAIKADPTLIDGYTHLMLVYSRVGRAADADKILAQALKRFPDRADDLRKLLGEMRSDEAQSAATGEGAAAPAEDPHAGLPAPGAAPRAGSSTAPAERPAPASPPRSVSGVLELDPAIQEPAPAGAVVFITLREPGSGAGPPLAVRRISGASFPLSFEIGTADSMTGEPIPDKVLIEARLDTDGDAATRPPSDPYGRADGTPMGAKGLKIVLKKRS